MNSLDIALGILSAMITPAVLISACGSLTISTSNRMARAIDRTRNLTTQFEQLVKGEGNTRHSEEELSTIYDQLSWSVRRSRLLMRAMTCMYLSLSVFVATSVAIGLVAVSGEHLSWLPTALGLVGAGLLFYTSLLLIAEIRLARIAINAELDFVLRYGESLAPKELLERRRPPLGRAFALSKRR
jgi:hypothetical protein